MNNIYVIEPKNGATPIGKGHYYSLAKARGAFKLAIASAIKKPSPDDYYIQEYELRHVEKHNTLPPCPHCHREYGAIK